MKKSIIPLMFISILGYSQEITLHLSEKYSKNQAYHVDSSGSYEQSVLIQSGDKIIKDESESFKFTGSADVTVLELDKDGRAIKSKFKIGKISKVIGAEKSTILAPGDEVMVSRDEKSKLKYEQNGVVLPKDIQKVLQMIVSVKNQSLPGDDDTFGPGKPVNVGDEWPINKENCIKGLSDIGVINPNDITIDGKFKLNSVAKVGSDDCAFVSGFMSLGKFAVDLPMGLKVDNSSMLFKATGVFPLGGVKNRMEETEDFKMELSAKGNVQKQGQEMPMSIVTKSSRKVSKKYK